MSLELLSLIWLVSVILVIKLAPSIVGGFGPAAPAKDFEDLAALLFGATSIAIVILSVVISLAAVVGWSHLRQSIREDVEKASKDREVGLVARWEKLEADLTKQMSKLERGMAALDEEQGSKADKLALDLSEKMELVRREEREHSATSNQGLRQEVVQLSNELRAEMSKEMRGRNLTIFGNMWGRMALKMGKPELEPGKEEFLIDAVDACEGAFEYLKNGANAPALILAMNNLVFYETIFVAAKIEPLPGRSTHSKRWLLVEAKKLLRAAGDHEDGTPRTIPLFLTFCAATSLLQDSENDLRQALVIAESINDRDDASHAQRQEARYYVELINRKLR